MFVDKQGLTLIVTRQMLMTAETQGGIANAYWIGKVDEAPDQFLQQWGLYVKTMLPQAEKPRLPFHCTVDYHEGQDLWYGQVWDRERGQETVDLVTGYAILGQEGVALSVEDNMFLKRWYEVPNACPHITVLVNKECESKQIGPMMKRAMEVQWQKTCNPIISTSPDGTMTKILFGAAVRGLSQHVQIMTDTKSITDRIGSDRIGELKDDMIAQVPVSLWSQHDTDVGLVRSVTPVQVKLMRAVRLPRKPQYPLKPDAEQGIDNTITGLRQTGVLIPTTSPCNTPILPVMKADKQKWRLVHDLRAINEVVEDFAAEVPNPHTLLSNIPPDAKYFTVIDLCLAFFSVPLAEESRYLFAFTYQGQQYTYTRLPQGFKHSPHLFNHVLKQDLAGLQLTSTTCQYVDDVLICSPTIKTCHADFMAVLKRLAEGGHKASLTKLQYCQAQVEYLGRVIAHGTKAIAPSHLEGISKAPKPRTVIQMMTF